MQSLGFSDLERREVNLRKRNRVSWFMIIVFMMTIFGGGFGAGISKAEAATQPTDINGHWARRARLKRQ